MPNAIALRLLRRFAQDPDCTYYSGVVYAMALKRLARIVYIQEVNGASYPILMSSDVNLAPAKIVQYYKLIINCASRSSS